MTGNDEEEDCFYILQQRSLSGHGKKRRYGKTEEEIITQYRVREENLAKIERVMVKLQQGVPIPQIAREENCTRTRVQRIRDNEVRLDGKTDGRPPSLPESAELYLAILIDHEVAMGHHIDSRCVT